MNISTLTLPKLGHQLKNKGIFLQTGTFITHLKTAVPGIAEGIKLLYSDYPLIKQADFSDFHVSLSYPSILRRWIKPQVQFLFDGKSPFKPLPADQAFPMLEWGLNWCVSNHANHYLIIHAAVIEKNGFAAILPAPPGSGKSTLCAALVCRGWRLLSDELTLIQIKDSKIIPLPRPVSLKNQSIDIIKSYATNAILSEKISDTIKGTVSHMKPPTESIIRSEETARAAWVVFPKFQSGAPAEIKELSQSRAFIRIADNAFNYSLLGTTGYETLVNVISASKCYDFTYSSLDDAFKIFSELKPKVS